MKRIPLLLFVLVLPWHTCRGELEDIKCMSRQSYRRSLQHLIEDDQDVFHIISTDNGGADHKDNYDFVRGSNWNRAIGSKFDHINCYQVGKLKCTKAVAISILLGSYSCSKDHPKHKKYLGPSAAELYKLGEEVMRDLRARRRSRDEL